MNPIQQNRNNILDAKIASLPADVRAAIAADSIGQQRTILPVPFWSTVRLQAARTAGPPVVLTIDTTPRKAFQYAIGQDMTVAGFTSTTAQPCDTNLLRAGETLDNADVYVWGLAAELCRRLGLTKDARAAYERALGLARQEPQRRFLERRLSELLD